ncbi:MAG: phycobilisome rod-core linker polypeptide [Pseudanabaena sp. CAN_BIN31]|nr:phycobilisome rod-core linker polypeptide [Pseudanabaena sp. CAN_BIN31]
MNDHTPITIDRKSTEADRQTALHQIYAQVLERQPYEHERKEIAKLEKDFLKGKLGVRHFIGELVMSPVYLNSFYKDCSNLKFVEWSFKHLLGRALQGKEEIAKFMDLLMMHGVSAFFHEILGSEEYRKAFGGFTIPYAHDVKFYDSPRNYLQTDLLQHEHVGQRGKVIPTIYWQQLGMDCETGTCVMPSAKVETHQESPKVKEPVSKALNEEIEELLQMLQHSDTRQVLQSMNENQRSLLRNLAK